MLLLFSSTRTDVQCMHKISTRALGFFHRRGHQVHSPKMLFGKCSNYQEHLGCSLSSLFLAKLSCCGNAPQAAASPACMSTGPMLNEGCPAKAGSSLWLEVRDVILASEVVKLTASERLLPIGASSCSIPAADMVLRWILLLLPGAAPFSAW